MRVVHVTVRRRLTAALPATRSAFPRAAVSQLSQTAAAMSVSPQSSPTSSSTSASTSSEKAPTKSGLYTRTGDAGTTSLYDGSRVPKESPVLSALGTLDELNAQLGLAAEHCRSARNTELATLLVEIQCRCFDMGSAVATPRPMEGSKETRKHRITTFGDQHVQELEKRIDALDSALPRLTNFVLPSGGLAACTLHVARVVARRAEREVWPMVHAGLVEEDLGRYLNRLSDFLFASARTAAVHEGRSETKYEVSKHCASEVSTS